MIIFNVLYVSFFFPFSFSKNSFIHIYFTVDHVEPSYHDILRFYHPLY